MKRQITFITGRRNMADGSPQLTVWRYHHDHRHAHLMGLNLYRVYSASPSSVKRMRRALDNAIAAGTFEKRITIWGTRRYERLANQP